MGTVMWDNDGVMSSWVDNYYPWLCAVEQWEQTEWRIWHHYRNHGMEDTAFVARLNQYAEEGGFADQVILPGVREAVERIKACGHTQHLVTDRPAIAEADTAWWLNEYLPNGETCNDGQSCGTLIDSLTISRDKTIFKTFGPPTYFAIDDRVENVQAQRQAGIFAYLLTKPWNEDSDLPRVATVGEFADIVCGGSVAA